MKKILLLSPPYVKDYMRNARCDFVSLSHSNWYPLWLGFAGALLEKNGYEVKLIDAPVYNLSHDETYEQIKSFAPDTIVVYLGRLSEDNDIAFAERLHDGLCKDIVFVGPYFSMDPKNTLSKTKYNFLGIQKEFEYPLLEYLNGDDYKNIKNFLYKQDDTVAANELRPYLKTEELDNIPFVSEFFYRHLDVRKYKVPSELYPYIDTMSGRGCAYGKCSFCLWVNTFIEGCRYNMRSINNIIDELEYIARNMKGVRAVMIQDDMLASKRARDIAEGILKRDIKIKWSCYMKPDKNVPYETFRAMKMSGCLNMHVGFESGDDEILRAVSKGNTVEDALIFSEKVHRAGLRIHGDFAIGFPGETKQTAQKTINLAKTINPYSAQFQIMIPFKGTPMYDYLKAKGWLDDNEMPSYPELSSTEIERTAKRAYMQFYFRFEYMLKILLHPFDYFFSRLDTFKAALPALFWKKWVR
ncbi:B12-binding domain-containing radical SAM protein [bacterium]